MHRLCRWHIPEWWPIVPLLALVLACVAGPERVAYAAEGNLDPTFGTGGNVVTDIGIFERSADVATQADGKIVVAAQRSGEGGTATSEFILIRYNVDGSLDASFGTNGLAFIDLNGREDLASVLAIQADGKIVVAGTSSVFPEQPQFAVARVNTDGSLDASFGTGGFALTPFGVGARVLGIAIQQDGRIVLVGGVAGTGGRPDIALVRYNPDGSLDLSFNGNGKVTTDVAGGQEDATGVAIQADGRIVVSATVLPLGSLNFDFALVRYNADGSLDSSFGGDGVVITDLAGGTDVAGAGVVVQSDGKIVVGGTTSSAGATQDLALVRYNTDGSLDATFGTNGIAVLDFGGTFESGTSLALQVDGKIVLGGTVSGFNGVFINDALLVRVDTDGSVDPSFGTNGFTTVDFVGRSEQQVSITIGLDGKIALTATTPSTIGFPFQDIGVARIDGLTPHALTFFMHGRDVAKTAGGFTMSQTAPERQLLLPVNFSNEPAWFSDPAIRGTLLPGGTVRLQLACTAALSLPKTVELAATAPDGSNPQVLGQVSRGLSACLGTETLTIPVARPVTLANQRLRLTISSSVHVPVLLHLGDRTFVQADAFIGAP